MAFEKFPGVDARLSTHMKSVGEVMAIGRTFKQAFAKAMRSRELDAPAPSFRGRPARRGCETPGADRYDVLLEAFRARRDARPRSTRARRSTRGSCASCASWRCDPRRVEAGVRTYRAVDTCAAEFAAETPYFYSAWSAAGAHEVPRGERPSVMILGSGPNRIGQGIEFDYCCVHAAMALREPAARR